MKKFENVLMIFGILMFVVLLSGIANSGTASLSGIKKSVEKVGDYSKITLTDDKSIKQADYTLISNTNYCYIDCNATGQVTFYNDENILFDSFKFLNKAGSRTTIFYKTYLNGNEYNQEKIKSGTYSWMITGQKRPTDSVDWIANAFGVEFSEWAWWNNIPAVDEVEAHGQNMNLIGNSSVISGMNITIGVRAINITSVSMNSSDTASRLVILNANKNIVYLYNFTAEAPAILPTPYTLSANTTYYIAADGRGAVYSVTYVQAPVTYPIAGTYLTWKGALDNFEDHATAAFNIFSIDVTLQTGSSGAVPNIILSGCTSGAVMVNYTFKDSHFLSLTSVNITSLSFTYNNATANKTFSYSNTTASLSSYKFCINPSYADANINGSIIYSTSSGAKSYNESFTNFNATYPTERILYTLTPDVTLSSCGSGAVIVNYTFKDENTLLPLSANITSLSFSYTNATQSKLFSYSNLTGTNSYKFCINPSYADTTINGIITYSASSYPQKTYVESGTFSTATTERTLYLLSDGIYSTYQIMNVYGNTVPGAVILLERQVNGVWITDNSGVADSAGSATFWVSPLTSYRITVSAAGYLPSIQTITPSQNLYTIILSSTTLSVNASVLQGVYWVKTPPSGLLSQGIHIFQFNITAANSNMVNCRFDLLNITGVVKNTTSSPCTNFSSLTIIHNFQEDELIGRYYADFGNGYILLEGDGDWYKIIPQNDTSNTLRGILNYLSDKTIWTDMSTDEYRRYEFTKIVLFFLIFAVIVAALNIFTGFDMKNPGIFLYGLPIVFIIVSIAGGISGQGLLYIQGATGGAILSTGSLGGFLDSFVIALYSLIIMVAYHFATLRKG